MNKLILAITVAATAAAALPANAAPLGETKAARLSAQSTIKVGNQCFKPTDGRGYGYWDSCDNVYSFVLGRRGVVVNQEVQAQIERGSDGGGGGDSGSGGGGGQR